jgi:hypothetical protein
MSFAVLMADADADMFPGWAKPGSMTLQLLITVAAFLGIGLIIFIWAAFFRKPHHRHHSSDFGGGGLPARHKRRSKLARMLGKKRRKRRRSREKPANPTLAEIGGLPPHRNGPPPS